MQTLGVARNRMIIAPPLTNFGNGRFPHSRPGGRNNDLVLDSESAGSNVYDSCCGIAGEYA
jgi:hypothetical protein